MVVARRGRSEQRLRQNMDRGGREQVAPAHDIGNVLQRIVDDDSQMIGCRAVLGAEQRVAPRLRRRLDLVGLVAFAEFVPVQRRRQFGKCEAQVEPPAGGFAPRQARFRLRVEARFQMQRAAVGIASPAIVGKNPSSRAEAGIDEFARFQTIKRRRVIRQVVALAAKRAVERDAHPAEIGDDCLLKLSLRTRRVGIFNSQPQAAAAPPRRALVAKRRIGVSEVQAAIGRRGEAEIRAQDLTSWEGMLLRTSVSKARPRRKPRAKSLPNPALIDGEASLALAVEALVELDRETIAKLLEIGGPPPLRLREPGFAGLAAIIVSQQVSVASAHAIFGRLEARIAPLDAATLLEAEDDVLRACGLSRPKVKTLRALAHEIAREGLELGALAQLEAVEAHGRLTRVHGVGPWTADIFLLFCLGHPDAFPAGDLALQEAARLALELKKRPDAKRLMKIAERWRPYRGVAARMLWAYYRVAKQRSGITIEGETKA